MRMKNKIGIITGAGTGIGKAGAVKFATEGATVVVVSLIENEVQEVVDEIKMLGGTAIGLTGDLSSIEFSKEIVNRTISEFGRIDFLWNHIGYPGPAQVENIDLLEFDITMNLNIKSGLVTTAQAIPHFIKQQNGSVIFTASTSGLQASSMSPLYSTAKFGVIGLTRSLARKYGKEQIRFNALCPGPVDTPMLRQFMTRSDDDSLKGTNTESLISKKGGVVPLQRIAKPEDVANAALFLASDESSYITGVALPVDGGLSA